MPSAPTFASAFAANANAVRAGAAEANKLRPAAQAVPTIDGTTRPETPAPRRTPPAATHDHPDATAS